VSRLVDAVPPPPHSAGRPFTPTVVPPVRSTTLHAGQIRYHIVRMGETGPALGMLYYGNSREWTRIYNANRIDTVRADGTAGILTTPDDLNAGMVLVIA
jgi:nucleoid-associated protein YgaU